MKTFIGDAPCPPLRTIVDALASGANQADANMRQVVAMDGGSCAAKCTPALWACLNRSQAGTLGAKMADHNVKACLQQSMECYKACAA
jgi:hypothetical protein